MQVTYKTYTDEKKDFLAAHNNSWRVDTYPMDEFGSYTKMYLCSDGAIWTECTSRVYETVQFTHRGCEFCTAVELCKVEYWNTDNSSSRYYYEKW